MRFESLKGHTLREVLRIIFRKAVYRKVLLGRYGVRAGESRAPDQPLTLRMEFLSRPDYEVVLGTNPYLTKNDLDHFRQQETVCVAIYDQDDIVASSWMTAGRVYVSELQRYIDVPPGQHFCCRSYVHEDYRGHALYGHMLHGYCKRLPPADVLWGLMYRRNTRVIRSAQRLGWRHLGDYWTRFILGRKFPGERHFQTETPL